MFTRFTKNKQFIPIYKERIFLAVPGYIQLAPIHTQSTRPILVRPHPPFPLEVKLKVFFSHGHTEEKEKERPHTIPSIRSLHTLQSMILEHIHQFREDTKLKTTNIILSRWNRNKPIRNPLAKARNTSPNTDGQLTSLYNTNDPKLPCQAVSMENLREPKKIIFRKETKNESPYNRIPSTLEASMQKITSAEKQLNRNSRKEVVETKKKTTEEGQRINVRFSPTSYKILKELSQKKGKTISDVLRDAVALERWLLKVEEEGGHILVERNGKQREIVRPL